MDRTAGAHDADRRIREARAKYLADGMEAGMAAGYEQLDELLALRDRQ